MRREDSGARTLTATKITGGPSHGVCSCRIAEAWCRCKRKAQLSLSARVTISRGTI